MKTLRETEAGFTAAVLDLAKLHGWRSAHFRPAMTAHGWRTPVQGDGKGFPDLVLVRGPRIIFAELKAAKGRLSDEQEAWLADLRGTPAEVYVWRPDDWDAIVQILAPS